MDQKAIMEFSHRVHSDLFSEVEPLSDVDLYRQLTPGTWSIAEVIEHLRQVDALLLKLFRRVVTGQKPSERRLSQRLIARVGLLAGHWVIARPLFKVNAPSFVAPLVTPPRPELIAGLRQVLDDLAQCEQLYSSEQLTRLYIKHPGVGALNFYELMLIDTYHFQRHLLQIQALKEKLKSGA